jgi:dolichyl-diphosphooligosaccharide--protein glycosyltransferase
MSDVPAGTDDATEALQDAWNWLHNWYEIPALLAIAAFMFWVRLQARENFIDGEKVYFVGNDAYYHFRQVNYVVRHWPSTMPFDPWSYFPYGTSQGQFGTLFDQLIATAALVIGLGSPSDQLIAEVVLVAPTVFGTLVVIPTYFIARRLGGRRAGVIAAVILALLPGTFLRRGLVGFADHNIAEVLFQAVAVLTVMVAVSVAERDQPVYELILDRDWPALRDPVRYSVAAGVALFLYVWLWPPAIVLVGILGIFFVLAISLHVSKGRSPEPLAVTGVVSMATLAILQLPLLDTTFETTRVSLLHVVLTAGVGLGCLFMAWLAREWDSRSIDRRYYPAVIGASVLASLGAIAVLLPTLYGAVVNNVLRTFAFGQTDTALTIAEAQSIPSDAAGEFLFRQYGLTFVTAMVGLVGLAYPVAVTGSYRPERLLVAVWAVAIALMAFTQVRFNYYLGVVVAVLTAWLVERFLQAIDLPSVPQDLEVFQVLALLIALVLVVAPLVPPLAAGHAVAVGESNGPGSVVTWTESLDWMEENTPAVGRYGGVQNDLDYYGAYERTGDFAYPEGAYGVMSWWDYGHWITIEGERIPNANPFQQGARPASAFLLAQNETRANLMLEALPSDSNAYKKSDAELRAIIADQSPQEAQEETRYVMIDDEMAAGKFSAIATWTGDGPRQYFSQQQFEVAGTQASLVGPNDAYHQTMLARLYFGDARGLSHYRLVHETSQTSYVVNVARQGPGGDFETALVNRRLSRGLLTLVQQRPDLAFYGIRQAATVKTYERVPGATLTGQVETENETAVFASLRLQTNTGRNVTYIQTVQTDDQGHFEMTVPYATTNEVGPAEGGTDTAVVAQGDYQLSVGNPFQPSATATTAVPEPAIYGGETITVDLEPVEAPAEDGNDTSNETDAGGNDSAVDGPIDATSSAHHTAPSSLATSAPAVLAAEPRRPLDA